MVGVVLVSHSRALASAARELVISMTGSKLALAIAAGAGEEHKELGTDAMEILEAIQAVMSDDGVLVLMDMGSALLSTETALGFLDEPLQKKVRTSSAPFIEGAVAAGVTASLGSSLDDVAREAEGALKQKQQHLLPEGGESAAPAAAAAPAEGGSSIRVTVRNPHGLHARPAARLIRESARFSSAIEVRNVTGSRGPATVKSLTGIAMLEVHQGDEIELTARGSDAAEALQVLKKAVESGLGDVLDAPPPEAAATRVEEPSGIVGVSGGIAIGPLFWGATGSVEVPAHTIEDAGQEMQVLQEAIASGRAGLAREEEALKKSVGQDEAAILQAQALVLEDPAIVEGAESAIRDRHENAAKAWHGAYETIAGTYEKLADPYLRQRAADVRDAGLRVLTALGVARPQIGNPAQPGILVVDDLAPTEVAQLSPESVLGVICLQGGKTSHAAILLRARGIPAVARAQRDFEQAGLDRTKGESIAAIDGDSGKLWLNPDAETLRILREQVEEQKEVAAREASASQEHAVTTDGKAVPIFANLGQPAEAAEALKQGAEGVGLFRTEFLFLHREQAPTEEEQFEALSEVCRTMGSRPVIIRTLDIGGDKEAPYLGLAKEANPFLGVRGLRLCLSQRPLFVAHLRAILRAAHGGNFRIMFPMVADPRELAQTRTILEEVQRSLAAAKIPHAWPIPVGIMIEVPSAVTLIDQFAPLVDFFSIGTNDLTQYVLAADRGNPALTHFQDALHPAVLRQIQQVVLGAHRHGKEVGVCGEAAADPDSARLFVGLGIDELSLSATRIPRIKAAIRTFSRNDAEALATKALALGNAAEVRALLAAAP